MPEPWTQTAMAMVPWYCLGVIEMTNFLKSFVNDESGASAAEYALILVVVGVAIVGAAAALSEAIAGAMSETATIIETGAPA